jgi:hypothetical protein
MDQFLINLGGQGFVDRVDALFENLDLRGKMMFVAPLIGGVYPIKDAPHVKGMVRRAVLARASFVIQAPQSPPLALSDAEIDKRLASRNTRRCLEGYYARSRKQSEWHPDHPVYREFRDRLMWSQNVPPDLAADQHLLGETWPDVSIPGFDDESLCWFPLEEYRRLVMSAAAG